MLACSRSFPSPLAPSLRVYHNLVPQLGRAGGGDDKGSRGRGSGRAHRSFGRSCWSGGPCWSRWSWSWGCWLARTFVTVVNVFAWLLTIRCWFIITGFHGFVPANCPILLVLTLSHLLPALWAPWFDREVKHLASSPRVQQGQAWGVLRGRWVVHCVCVGRVQPVGRRSRASLSPPSTFSLSVALILPHILTLLPPIICALVLVTSPTLLLFCALCLTLVLHYTASPPEPEGGTGCLAGDVVGLHLVRQPAPASCTSPGKHQHPALTEHQQLQPGLKPKTLSKTQQTHALSDFTHLSALGWPDKNVPNLWTMGLNPIQLLLRMLSLIFYKGNSQTDTFLTWKWHSFASAPSFEWSVPSLSLNSCKNVFQVVKSPLRALRGEWATVWQFLPAINGSSRNFNNLLNFVKAIWFGFAKGQRLAYWEQGKTMIRPWSNRKYQGQKVINDNNFTRILRHRLWQAPEPGTKKCLHLGRFP